MTLSRGIGYNKIGSKEIAHASATAKRAAKEEHDEEIRHYMEENGMFRKNGNIVAGVSGGPDSVCLLLVLCELRENCDLHLTAVHVHHGLRQEAGEDARFVEELCRRLDVPCRVVHANVADLAREQKISEEEAGRHIRYEAFEKELVVMDEKTGGHGCVAVAHNRDDRAETLLFHLLRGTGLDGMASIRPVRPLCAQNPEGPRVIRPLLETERTKIEAFLQKRGVSWRTDSTNEGERYARNRSAIEFCPMRRKRSVRQPVNIWLRKHGCWGNFRILNRYTYREALERCEEEGDADGLFLAVDRLRKESPLLQKLCVRDCLRRVGGGRNLTSAHVEAALALAGEKTQSGRQLRLPACRVEAVREFGRLKFAPWPQREGGQEVGAAEKDAALPLIAAAPIPLRIPRSMEKGERQWVPGLGEISVRLLPGPAWRGRKAGNAEDFLKNIPEKTYTKWFDYDNIIESAVFRTRRTQDYLTISGAMEKKSLKRYLIEEKIPAGQRDSLTLLADGAQILWVPGHRISAAYKVTVQTAVILEVHIRGGDEDERESGSITDEREVDERIQAIGEQISKDYAGKQVHLVCVLKGGAFFMCELAKRISVPVSLDFMSVSSYGSDTKSSGVIRIVKDLDESLKDKDVIVVEDIVDSGRTLSYLLKMLQSRGPRSLALCTLLDKPERRVVDVNVNYTGFQIPDEFVVGYGLDYDQRYRNLPYIGVVKFDE